MRSSSISFLVPILAASTATCSPRGVAEPPRPAATASPPESTYTTERMGDVHDFDFIAGDWTLKNRQLRVRGVGSNQWDEFPATTHGIVFLGGIADVDEISFPTKGFSGPTLRTFNVEKHQWSIYWINSKTGVVFPPVVGGFQGDRGEFYGEDEDGGHPVKVRFIWTKLGADRARWEQAYSPDGRAWETNWMNELERARPRPTEAATSVAGAAPTAVDALRAGDVHDFDFIAGDWRVP
jgi:hypothetical protein